MKLLKILFMFLASVLLCSANVWGQTQQDLSPNAQKFKTNLLSFLREEGYIPTVDNNGKRVNFKREGESYWINLSGSMPINITMHIEGFTNKDANSLALILACNDVNRDMYYIKAYIDQFGDEGYTNICIEMPCHTAEEFRYVFSDCVKALASAKSKIQEAYNKNQEDLDNSNKPFEITGCTVANTDKGSKIITDYGNQIYSWNSKYLQARLTIKSEKSGQYTIYYKLYKPDGTLSTGTSSPSGYTSSTDINIKAGTYTYQLSGWGSDTAGHWKAGNYKYEFYCNGASLGYYEFTIK